MRKSRLVSKKSSGKNNSFYKKGYFAKRPLNSKQISSKSEKYKFTNIFSRFVQCGQFSLKGYKPKSMNSKVRVTFSLSWALLKKVNVYLCHILRREKGQIGGWSALVMHMEWPALQPEGKTTYFSGFLRFSNIVFWPCTACFAIFLPHSANYF